MNDRWVRSLLLLLVILGATSGCARNAVYRGEPEGRGRFELTVLGIAQDGGLPHVGCEKACCVEARRDGRELYPACLGIRDRHTGKLALVEATPAIEKQLALWSDITFVHRGRKICDAILLTHAHIGHYAGLVQLGREVASVPGIPLHVTPRFSEFLRTNGPWKQLVDLEQVKIREIPDTRIFEPIPGLKVEALSVPHRDEYSDTVAFRFRGSDRTVLFVPDIDSWHRVPGDAFHLARLIQDVDVAYVDATLYDGRELPGRDLSEIPHPPVVETMKLLAVQARAKPGKIRFIHLNHTNPLLRERHLVRDLEKRGFRVARQGERVRF